VVAPDDLGSGFSDHPNPNEIAYTFDLLAKYTTEFTEVVGLKDFVLYVQDFGAPIGFRMAIAHPERISALVVQNGNAYLDGLSQARRQFFLEAHDDRSPARAAALTEYVSDEAIERRQYLRDVPGDRAARMSPDTWTQDIALMPTALDRLIQVQLFQDYQTNIDAYPAWQAFLREHRPPTLIVWGRNDPVFIPAGAQAYLRDLPDAELHLLDAGHFAVEEDPVAIAQYIVNFVDRLH
jgi:pimeloyl-ACP methyl ester carboxylesterase